MSTTHVEHSRRVRNATPCTPRSMTYGGRCLACGWASPHYLAVKAKPICCPACGGDDHSSSTSRLCPCSAASGM